MEGNKFKKYYKLIKINGIWGRLKFMLYYVRYILVYKFIL